MRLDYPGIGGSLGECVLCGQPFVLEIFLGHNVPLIGIDGFKKDLPVHQACLDKIKPGDPWTALPEGPLRKEYEQHFSAGGAQ